MRVCVCVTQMQIRNFTWSLHSACEWFDCVYLIAVEVTVTTGRARELRERFEKLALEQNKPAERPERPPVGRLKFNAAAVRFFLFTFKAIRMITAVIHCLLFTAIHYKQGSLCPSGIVIVS